MFSKTFDMHEQSDADGFMQITIPVGEPSTRYHVVVQVTAEAQPVVEPEPTPPKRQWSEGFFDRTYGKWEGELERAPQGEFEKREEF